MADTSHDVADGTLRDGAEDAPSRAVVNFFGPPVKLPSASSTDAPTVFTPYHNGDDKCLLQFGTPGAGMSVQVWTDEDGIAALCASLQGLLIRAAIMRDADEAEQREHAA